MSRSYLAWDGNRYSWPPPENWHEAVDGRWWAPNSGPGPASASASRASSPAESVDRDSDRPFSNAERSTDPKATSRSSNRSRQQRSDNPERELSAISQRFGSGPSSIAQKSAAGTSHTALTNVPKPPTAVAGNGSQQFDGRPAFRAGVTHRPTGYSPDPRLLFIGGAAALAFLIVIAAILVRGDSSENTASDGSSTSTTLATTTTAQVAPNQPAVPEAPASPPSTAAAVAPAPAPTPPPTTVPPTTTTTAPPAPGVTEDPAVANQQFRQFLQNRNLGNASDGDLLTIGTDACIRAANSPTPAAWRQQINAAARQAQENPATVRVIYSGALRFYCPAQAQRLRV